MTDMAPYNPLDKKNIAINVATALLSRDPIPLTTPLNFIGAGIYAIYYTGSFPVYSPIAQKNRDGHFEAPIYIGKAVPIGYRKGVSFAADPGKALQKRLQEHAQSIHECQNLSLDDFYCRFLVVDDIWIPLGESLLIAWFSPIWNTLLDGFGNHNPGRGRQQGMRPKWDTLHPGRHWALQCRARPESSEQIIAIVEQYLKLNQYVSKTTYL